NKITKVNTGRCKIYCAIPNDIIIVTIFIIILGIILYIYCLYNETGMYFINIAFAPSLEIAVMDMYINIVKNCIIHNIIPIIKNEFVGVLPNIFMVDSATPPSPFKLE